MVNKKKSDKEMDEQGADIKKQDEKSSDIVLNNRQVGSQIYKLLIDSSTAAIFLSKSCGQIIDANKAAEQMFGYTKEDFLILGEQGIIDQSNNNLQALFTQRKETGKVIGEQIGITKSGFRFPIEYTSSVFIDDFGEEFMCTIMQDITGRKTVEQEMLLLLNNTDESFLLLNKELFILNYNKKFKDLYEKYFNISIEKGRSILSYEQPDRTKSVAEIYEQALLGNNVFSELATENTDGTKNYFELKYSPSKNSDEEINGVFITVKNTTIEKSALIEIADRQALLEQAENTFREIFENAGDGMIIHEIGTGKLLDINEKACEILEAKKDFILSEDPEIFMADEVGFSFDLVMEKVVTASDGQPQFFDWQCKSLHGNLNWLEVKLQKVNIAGTDRILTYFRVINDRKNAEALLELQRKDKEALINNTDDLIWSIDCDYKLIVANNAYLHMMYHVAETPHKMGDTVMIEEFGESINNKWKVYYQRALAGEKFSIEDEFMHPKTKRQSYELVSFNPIFKDENVVGVACYSKNITELKENQIALKATNAELDNIMASSQDMICTVASDDRIVRVSAASEIILGYKPEELIGKFIFDFVYDDDKEKTKNHAKELMAGQPKPIYYNRYVRKDGSLVYLEWTAKWDAQSSKRYGVARDVTAKVEAENKLKLSEQRFRSLVQDGSDLVCILADDATYKYVSPTSFAILGYEADEFTGKAAYDFIHPDDVEIVQDHFALLQTTKKITLPHFRFKNKKGEWRWMDTSLTNLMEEPAINGIVANSRDITERKNIENALLVTKENYKNLFENSPAPMFIFDFETLQIIDCNVETLLKYGYTKEEFLQLTIKDIRPQEDINKIEAAVSDEIAYGTIHKNIWRHKKKNGEIMHMDISGHLIDYDGRRVSVVMLIDVTEKLKMEEEKEFEKRDKEALINNTEDLIWSVSKDFKLIAANQAYILNMEKLTDLVVGPGSDIIMDGHFPEPFLNFWRTCYLRALNGETFKEEIYNKAMHLRSERWLEVNFNPIRNGNEITGLACNARDITDNKIAAEELRESEEKYRLLFYNSPLPKWICDSKTFDILEVNEKAINHYGYTRDEFLRINTKNLITTTDFNNFENTLENVINEKSFSLRVVNHFKKNKELIKVEISGHKIIYKNVDCIMVIINDVTEREKALQILKDKDAKLEHAQEIAKLGYWQLDLKTKLFFWSKEIYKIWDLPENFKPDVSFFVSTIHPSDKNNFIRLQNAAIEEGENFDLEHRIILVDGTVKWIYEKAQIEKNLNGEVVFLTGTAQDITERKRAEEKLEHSNERYEQVTKATYDAIWEWDLTSNSIYRAEGFERSFGFNLEELNNAESAWENYIHEEDRQPTNESMQSAIKSNKTFWSHEYRLLKPDGEQAYVEDRAYIIRNEAGEALRIVGALRDITETKYYHELEILEREVLEKNTQGEESIEEVIEKYIVGIQKLHPGMLCSTQKIENNKLYNLSSPDLPKDYLAAISGIEIGDNEGSCGTAAFLKEKVIVSDIETDIRWAKYKETAAKAGLRACWSCPIFDSKNNVVATFAVYYQIIKAHSLQEENTINRAGNILQTILESYHREAALFESNQRYLNVTKATFDAIWDWDLRTNNVYWGETYLELFGDFQDEGLTDTEKVYARLHPDERETIIANANASLEGNDLNFTIEHRYLKEDKSYAYVLNRALIVRNKYGEAIRVFGAMQDITQKKKEEGRLKLMSSVVTSTNDAVLITEAEPFDEPGPRIVYINEAFTKMTGYTEEDLIGKTPRIFQGVKTDIFELSRLKTALNKWESCEVTIINYKKNGEEFWNNFTVSPVADEKGRYTHWISIERDVTERRNEELQKELLRKIRIIFNEPIGINATLDKVLKDVTTLGDFCFAESWLLSADKKEIKRATYYVADFQMRTLLANTPKISVQKEGEGIVGKAWETLDLQVWEPNSGVKNILDEKLLVQAGVKKLYALPFLNNSEIIGVLVFALYKPGSSILKFENLFSSLKNYLGAEIKRKQLELELNQIFNFAPDIIAIVGKDGYFKKLNPAACDLLEYSLEELMARPLNDFVHAGDKAKTGVELGDIAKGKTSFYFENRYITKTGKIKWLAWTSTPSAEDEVIFAVAKNITEKKDLEVVLEKSNQLARIGNWEFEIAKNTFYWSEVVKEIHETPPGFIPTLENIRAAYKEDRAREEMVRLVKEAIEKGTGWDLEVQIVTQKGNEKWIRSIGAAEFLDGKCVKLYGSTQDINQRKQAEESIRSSEERRELIMNAALDAIICIDKMGEATFWNPQAESIFGWKEQEVIGKRLTDIIIPERYRRPHGKGMSDYFETSKGNALNILLQLSAIKKTGEEFPIELTILPIEQDGEEFFCAFIRDITERKLSESKLLELNTSLQKQTQELALTNQELEQFAYVASHDLQEPLRMVSSFLTQLGKKYDNVLDEKGKKYIHFAVDGAKRMRQIILDLLEFSRIGRTDELIESIDLNEIVAEIKILYSSKIKEQKAIIESDNLPIITSFKSPVKQVFQNLISNALKYCKPNNPCKIHISATATATHWEFSIKDNGIGINKDYFDKIFVIFQRLHSKEVYAGTGMGLSVTKKIIESLNGKIWLESVEGEGSVFFFTIPNI